MACYDRSGRHLIFDEADLWAPEQDPRQGGRSRKTARGHEDRGAPETRQEPDWLISQRPAALFKGVPSQGGGLVAYRLTASHDRKALGLSIEGQADREVGKALS
jgi:uncharacterized protein